MKTSKPGKQRKRLYQAPLHKRYKQFSASLSMKLKASHNTNSIPVRLGDTVQIMRGDRKGFEGKVLEMVGFFKGIGRIKYEAPNSKNPSYTQGKRKRWEITLFTQKVATFNITPLIKSS